MLLRELKKSVQKFDYAGLKLNEIQLISTVNA